MTLSEILSFVVVASLLVMSPGPNGVLIAKTVPTSGRAAGFANIAGFVAPAALVECGLSEEIIRRVDFHDLDADVDTVAHTVLDVRGAAEYAGARVPGAINIAHTRLTTRLSELPKEKPVLTYCRTGNRAAAAAALLAREGYDVTLVDGEFAAWPGLRPTAEPVGAA